jgi:hypothetical protein
MGGRGGGGGTGFPEGLNGGRGRSVAGVAGLEAGAGA